MTISRAVDPTLAELRTRLSQSLNGGVIDLSDELFGLPVLDRLFHSPVLVVRDAQLDLSVPDAVGLHGTADLLGASGVGVDLRFAQNQSAITGLLNLVAAPGGPVKLSGVLGTVAGAGLTLPPEVPDVGFTALTFSIAPRAGAFVLDCTCKVPWSLPFGGAGLAVGQVGAHLERTGDEGAPVQVTLRLGSAGALVVADGFQVTGFDLAFTHSGAGEWALEGTLAADLLDHPVDLGASITNSADRREFAFRASAAAPTSVDLAAIGSLSMDELSIVVARTIGSGARASGARLDTASAYGWTVEAAGTIDLLNGAIVVDGTVTVQGEPGMLSLALRLPKTSSMQVREVKADRWIPAVVGVVDHLGTAAREVFGARDRAPDRLLGHAGRQEPGHGLGRRRMPGTVADPRPRRQVPEAVRRRPGRREDRDRAHRRPDAKNEFDHGTMGADLPP